LLCGSQIWQVYRHFRILKCGGATEAVSVLSLGPTCEGLVRGCAHSQKIFGDGNGTFWCIFCTSFMTAERSNCDNTSQQRQSLFSISYTDALYVPFTNEGTSFSSNQVSESLNLVLRIFMYQQLGLLGALAISEK